MIFIACVTIYQLGLFVWVALKPNYRDSYCNCSLTFNTHFLVGHILGYFNYFIELVAFLYFSCKIFRLNIHFKYNIK